MPPGTGDIQITLSQILNFDGAVIVTTPHFLSLVDAAKGVAMFQQMNIPTLAMVPTSTYQFHASILFIHSFIHSFIYSFIHSFYRS